MEHAASPKTPTIVAGASAVSGGLAAGLLQAPAALLGKLAAWQRQAEERATLTRLSDYQLQDLGLSRGAVEDMARKPFWTR